MLKRNMANPSGGILKSFSDIILKGYPNILCSPDEAITEERHINMNIEGIMILKHLLTDSVMLVNISIAVFYKILAELYNVCNIEFTIKIYIAFEL